MGRGSGVRQVSASSYELSFVYQGQRCREKIKLPPSKANLEYLVRFRAEILNAIERDTFEYGKFFPNSPRAKRMSKIPGLSITVAEALEYWLKQIKPEVEKSTFYDYEKSVFNFLIPAFGTLYLSDINKSDVRAWAAGLDVSQKRLSNLLIPLRRVLADAFDDDLVEKNPLHGWTLKRKGTTKSEPDPFIPQEIEKILAKATGQVRNLIQFWLWTGLRTSEICALQWGDIDDEYAHIRDAYVLGETKGPKTMAGNRKVLLLGPALDALEVQKQFTWFKGGHVFENPNTGEPWKNNASFPMRHWKPLLHRAKVKYREPYQLRHTYASTMISSGENIHFVARQLGHKDVTVLLRTYGRWIPEIDPSAGSRAEELAQKRS